jgi:hypothetical protein
VLLPSRSRPRLAPGFDPRFASRDRFPRCPRLEPARGSDRPAAPRLQVRLRTVSEPSATLERETGFEPATPSLEGSCSSQLSYSRPKLERSILGRPRDLPAPARPLVPVPPLAAVQIRACVPRSAGPVLPGPSLRGGPSDLAGPRWHRTPCPGPFRIHLHTALCTVRGGEGRIRTSEGMTQQIYSLPRLAASVPLRQPRSGAREKNERRPAPPSAPRSADRSAFGASGCAVRRFAAPLRTNSLRVDQSQTATLRYAAACSVPGRPPWGARPGTSFGDRFGRRSDENRLGIPSQIRTQTPDPHSDPDHPTVLRRDLVPGRRPTRSSPNPVPVSQSRSRSPNLSPVPVSVSARYQYPSGTSPTGTQLHRRPVPRAVRFSPIRSTRGITQLGGAGDGTRTRNLRITNPPLYPLSYASPTR